MKKCLWDECGVETSNPKFCSLSCGTKYQRKYSDVWSKTYDPKSCKQCGKDFQVNSNTAQKVFCSRSCSATFNNRARGSYKKPPTKVCEQCGSASRNRFCSVACSGANKRLKKIQSWLNGEWGGTSSSGLSRSIRHYLIEQAEHRCQSPTCAVPGGFAEINPKTGRCPLEIDHIDGNCYNNSSDNLIVVCPNCHALTPTYRALNKNSGRAYRRV